MSTAELVDLALDPTALGQFLAHDPETPEPEEPRGPAEPIVGFVVPV
jgi:hypothetical protein